MLHVFELHAITYLCIQSKMRELNLNNHLFLKQFSSLVQSKKCRQWKLIKVKYYSFYYYVNHFSSRNIWLKNL